MTNHVSVVPPYFRNFQSHKEPAFKGPRLACRVEAHTELVLARPSSPIGPAQFDQTEIGTQLGPKPRLPLDTIN